MFSELSKTEGYSLGSGFWNLTHQWDSHKIAQAVDWYLQGGHTADEIGRKFNLTSDDYVSDPGNLAVYNTNVPNSVRTGMADISTAVPFSTTENNYHIEMHIDSIDSDYDVDRMTERFIEKLSETSSYRSTNSVTKLR